MDDFARHIVNPKTNRRAFALPIHLSTTLECFAEIIELAFLPFPDFAFARLIIGADQRNCVSRHSCFCLASDKHRGWAGDPRYDCLFDPL